jgi:uncharacterized protein
LVVSVVTIFSAETPIPPTPTRWVTDTANFMSPGAVSALDSRLQSYEQQSGHQIIVYIGQTTGDTPIEDWAVKAFEKWKVGRKGMDDGLALFIMAQDHKLRFEVGYGLEGEITDALAARIINEIMVPRIKAGDADGAVTAGIDAVASSIAGQGLGDNSDQRQDSRGRRPSRPITLGQLILYGIIGVIVLIVFITNPTLAIYLLMSLLSGGGGGGNDRGGGGGFGGGGGRSGGGGASGSW